VCVWARKHRKRFVLALLWCYAAVPFGQPAYGQIGPAEPPSGDIAADAPLAQPEPQPSPPEPRRTYGSPIVRLASVPNMFGDFLFPGGQVRFSGYESSNYEEGSQADVPLAGGARRAKISENNKALPMDRVFFSYNHYQNALSVDPDFALPERSRGLSLDRYTVGIEKTFHSGLWSAEVRMPFVGQTGFAAPDFSFQSEEIGNLAVIFKRLTARSPKFAAAVGLGIDTPTGSDVTGSVQEVDYRMHNQAVYLSPWVGFLHAPRPRLFWQGSLQVDVPTGGNRITYAGPSWAGSGSLGVVTDQTLMLMDLSIGYWIQPPRSHGMLRALAPVVEFHYTTTLEDAEVIHQNLPGSTVTFGNLLGHVEMMQLTVGLHAQLGANTTVRAGGVFPLLNVDRPFDSEVMVSVNRYY